MEKVTIIPYLAFRGCCEEAIRMYIHAFGGEVYYLSRWTEETCGGESSGGEEDSKGRWR